MPPRPTRPRTPAAGSRRERERPGVPRPALSEVVRAHLRAIVRDDVRFDEPLAPHTTFRIGGPAEAWIQPRDLAGLKRALRCLHELSELGVPVRVLGAGSNLLVSDAGARGAVLHLGEGLDAIEVLHEGPRSVRLRVGAGLSLTRLARFTVERGWAGLAWAVGVPARLGGAIVMNAGAHGSEMKDVVRRVDLVDRTGRLRRRTRAEMAFGYRRSRLPAGAVVARAELALKPADPGVVRDRLRGFQTYRRETQPLQQPNAGSVFVNPNGDSAGRLIEAAGLKGHRVGGAAISTVHANFIVNLGGASAADVAALVRAARDRVRETAGVELVPEIRPFGDWDRGDGDGGAPW